MTRVAWLDCRSGVSGDMLLGALTALGAVDVPAVARALDVDVEIAVTQVRRGALAATRVDVRPHDEQPHRRLAHVTDVVCGGGLPEPVTRRAVAVFRRLAEAESRVHGVSPDEVEFHEVGAVDAIVDVVACCAGLHALALDRLVVAPIALGGGTARSLHGDVPVPVPAVLELLRGSPLIAHGGPDPVELATPTGVAVLTEWASTSGDLPPIAIDAVGVGAGGRDLDRQPNVARLVVGSALAAAPLSGWQLVEANVDDLDPRVWPVVLDRLLAAGAADAWLTPILMKKGRPAHTLTVLCADDAVEPVTTLVFAETSTIGLRSMPVSKRALAREWVTVCVDGHDVRVKVARVDGAVVNASPEFDDVVAVATALRRPVKSVLNAAAAAAHSMLS